MAVALIVMFAVAAVQILLIVTFGVQEPEPINIPIDDDNETFFYYDF